MSKEDLSDDYFYPAYSSESINNGIIGYTNNPEFICNDEHPVYVTFGDHTKTFNIAYNSFSVLDNVKVLLPCTNSYRALLWMITAWKKKIPNLGYARHWKIAKNCVISLPVKKDNIDFDFMESFIAELEAESISELSAYLKANGLDNYELSYEEQKALDDLENIEWKEYKISEIFDVKNTHNILSRDIKENSGKIPYLGAGEGNNSVISYISHDMNLAEKGDCIFIGGKTFVVTYQPNDYFSNDSHNLALYIRDENLKGKRCQLALASCIYKGLKHKYSWGDSISHKKIQNNFIQLPQKNGQIDFKFMETLISAIQKLVIKDVVLYTNEKIEATKAIVSEN